MWIFSQRLQLNACGCNQNENNDKKNLNALALSETRLKGLGVKWFRKVQGAKSSISEGT